MGVDWGGKDDTTGYSSGKSFSSVVVVSVGVDGVFQIENAFKLKRNDLDHKLNVVAEMFKRFDIKLAVADLGYGHDTVAEIQREFGGRFIGCLSSGNTVHPIRYDHESLRMVVNPSHILEELFGHMRRGKILFPWKSYEQIQWLIEHCCSMEKQSQTIQGRVLTRFVKGTGPNDGLMALMYSYLAYKFYLTQGFKVKPHQMNAQSDGPVLAYLPRRL
jgi:hypothetical protein